MEAPEVTSDCLLLLLLLSMLLLLLLFMLLLPGAFPAASSSCCTGSCGASQGSLILFFSNGLTWLPTWKLAPTTTPSAFFLHSWFLFTCLPSESFTRLTRGSYIASRVLLLFDPFVWNKRENERGTPFLASFPSFFETSSYLPCTNRR